MSDGGFNMPDFFGCMVFNESVMQSRLPREVYQAWKKTITQQKCLELDVANVVANAMKDWAVEKGATHFTHWFQPMTGITAEKHESFIVPTGDGRALMEFSGSSLVRGESDASSFPSGGLRATFEARGYTVWDTTSYAFIKDKTLFIPTAFCSYCGEALDEKTPLLKSMEALNKQALRILRLFNPGTRVKAVLPVVGAEQEYFLVDAAMYAKRPDLVYCGRTLFGARPPKGQELYDHYYGSIKPRVAAYMEDLEKQLWRLGVYAKTKHNEAAPAQHEIAPLFTTVNIATDHNQLTMDIMKNIAAKHGLVCLLHEKPFSGVNGSGKHNNWSMRTDRGANLLEPGETPYENAQFLLFLIAVMRAVDVYQDLLRASVAGAGNDHRLGSHEAPPAIISMFLGDELDDIIKAMETKAEYENRENEEMEIGAAVLPHFLKDSTDRNRTSPFAFTGNKFEFRMLGSSASIAEPNIVINTIVAEALRGFADELESPEGVSRTLWKLLRRNIREHRRIVYNGNNYSEKWVEEAAARGLSNLPDTAAALSALVSEKSKEVFTRHGVFTEQELQSRYEIFLENYCKAVNIEAFTMVSMVRGSIVPGVLKYQQELISLISMKKAIAGLALPYDCSLEEHILTRICHLSGELLENLTALEETLASKKQREPQEAADFYSKHVCTKMAALRSIVDELEAMTASEHWPFPSYGELLHSV